MVASMLSLYIKRAFLLNEMLVLLKLVSLIYEDLCLSWKQSLVLATS